MGYTHYWNVTEQVPPLVWERVCDDTRKVILVSTATVQWEDDDNRPPKIDGEAIRFNGVGEAGHETFMLKPEPAGFQFCKTAQKPYDILVCAVLIIANRRLGDAIRIQTDGEDRDWKPALGLVTQVLGEGYAIPEFRNTTD